MKIDVVSKDLLSLENAVRELHINRATIFRWIDEGKMLTLKLAKSRVIPKAEVERLRRSDAKRKYVHHKAPGQLPKVLQPLPLPKVKQPPLA